MISLGIHNISSIKLSGTRKVGEDAPESPAFYARTVTIIDEQGHIQQIGLYSSSPEALSWSEEQ